MRRSHWTSGTEVVQEVFALLFAGLTVGAYFVGTQKTGRSAPPGVPGRAVQLTTDPALRFNPRFRRMGEQWRMLPARLQGLGFTFGRWAKVGPVHLQMIRSPHSRTPAGHRMAVASSSLHSRQRSAHRHPGDP